MKVHFQLNHQEFTVQVSSQMCLLRFLRDRMGLMGTKDGCSTGHCGACTVIINGKAQRACLVKMARVDGAKIETVENLSKNGVLHPLQRAFIEKGAVQCGYCIPGMLMTSKALLDRNPHPTAHEIKHEMTVNRNICRCTGYTKIVEAVQLAAERMPWGASQTVPKEEITTTSQIWDTAERMVTGAQQYGDDIVLEGNVVHGKILWAAHPHARILSIDTSEAEAMPGVVTVVTAKDIPGKNQAGLVVRDQPAIASDKVLYIGDGLAAVFAETPEFARAALEKIKVAYEVLPGVFSPEEAARPDAPKLHPNGNLLHHASLIRGDTEKAFEECAVVVEGSYKTPFVEHGFLEPESGIAYVEEDGTVVLMLGTQTAFDDRIQLSEILAMPEEKIRVIAIIPGGAFGAKEDMILQQYLALGALKTRRPVKMVLSRQESLRVHQKRHPAWIHYKTGAARDGQVLAIEMDITLDTGAYCALGIDILENTVVFGAGPYYVPNLKIIGHSWYTNNVMAGAMRGFGVNQVAFGLEQQMDAMGRALGMNPFEFRLKNALDVGLPTASDHVMTEGIVSIKQTIQAAWDEFKKTELPASHGGKIGVGVASAVKNIGFGHGIPESAGAIVELEADGRVLVRHSQHEYGQGARMGILRMASNQLGIPAERIRLVGPDTALTPKTGPTTASRQTFLTGNAVVMACNALKDQLFAHAAETLSAEPSKLGFKGDRIVNLESGESLPLSQLGERFVVERRYTPPQSVQMHDFNQPSRFGRSDFKSMVTHVCYAYNTQVAIVEVFPETGEVKVLKIISANDVGKVLNRTAIEGQIEGGAVMGLGFALSEEFVVENGINLTDTLQKVRLPTADMSPEIVPLILEIPHPFGPQGVKGFAEAPSLATAPAIINAIYDAVGVRANQLPADKRRVKEMLEKNVQLHMIEP
jgi:CO/xanthine dehydrogenase Mo-binding subunit/aerobic-type carbon monoxide dehydrogenase small subunit (CoxS/CutS family)